MLSEIHVKFIAPKKWWNQAKWELLKEYKTSSGNSIPVGFISDGASIPYGCRNVFSPTGRYFGAAIVHDYYITVNGDWKTANSEFNKELKALGIMSWRRMIIMTAVRIQSLFN